jgi:hypothetical protein
MVCGLRAAQAQQHVRLERDLGPLRARVTDLHQASTEATQRVPRPCVCLEGLRDEAEVQRDGEQHVCLSCCPESPVGNLTSTTRQRTPGRPD